MLKKVISAVMATVMLSTVALSSAGCSAQKNSTIKIGLTCVTVGPFAAVGVPYGNFYKAFVEHINANPDKYKASLNGKKLEMISYDDGGDGAVGKTYIEKLINDDKVDALVGVLGTWNIVAAKDVLMKAAIPAVYFGTGSSAQMFEPAEGDARYMMGVQPLYKTEGRLMYLRTQTSFDNVKKIGVIHSDADDGISLKAGIEQQFSLDTRANKPEIIFQQIASGATKTDITSQVNAIAGCDIIIAAANQAPFQAIYKATQENAATKGKPIITTYVNVAPTNMPEEAVDPTNSDIYGAAWVVFTEQPGSSPEADRRLADYKDYCSIVDADTKNIPADQKEAYKTSAYAMSSYIAIRTFLVGLERLNEQKLDFTPANYLKVMEAERVPVAISGGVNYKDGYRIGLDSLSFVVYKRPAAGSPAQAGSFEQVDAMASIDELFGSLK